MWYDIFTVYVSLKCVFEFKKNQFVVTEFDLSIDMDSLAHSIHRRRRQADDPFSTHAPLSKKFHARLRRVRWLRLHIPFLFAFSTMMNE
jgi:hypothetical protein